jgi:hypothetical protein
MGGLRRAVRRAGGSRGWRVGIGAALAALVVAFTALSAGGAAPDPPGISFDDDRPLSPTKRELGAGVESSVCNTTDTDLAANVGLTGFAFTSKATAAGASAPLAIEAELAVTPSTTTQIAAGSCITIAVKQVLGAPQLTESSYEGFIVVSTNGGGLARRALTVPGPDALAAPVVAADPISLHGSFGRLALAPEDLDLESGDVPLAAGSIALSYEGSRAPKIASGTRLGVVTHGGDTAVLRTTSASRKARDGVIVVDVKLHDAPGQGIYTGKLDTAIAGTKDKPVSVTVTVADNFALIAAALAVGLALGLLAKLASGRWLPERRFKSRRSRLTKRYSEGGAAFAAKFDGYKDDYAPPTAQAIEAFRVNNLAKQRRYTRSTFLLAPTDPGFKTFADELASAEEDARVLGSDDEVTGLGPALVRLDKKLDEFAKYVSEHFPRTPVPALGRKAAAILDPPPGSSINLPVLGATKLVADIKAVESLVDAWMRWGNELRRYRIWLVLLGAALDGAEASGSLGTDDLAKARGDLRRAARTLIEVMFELLDTTDQASVDRMATADDLATVYRILARVSGRVGLYVPSEWEVEEGESADVFEGVLSFADIGAFPVRDGLGVDAIRAEWLSGAIPHGLDVGAEAVTQFAGRAVSLLLELLVLTTSFGLALIASFRQLYEGKPFGSRTDYLSVVLLGMGAELLVSGVFTAIALWRPPQATPPAAAAAASPTVK